MHIPDGYLSPSTCAVFYAAAAPFWVRALRRVRGWARGRKLPLVALMAAASFVIMMFNVPLPGGTTAHAVGAVLAAIILGPWPAVLAISVALAIQALFFGDGGLLAFGANCFNMAVVMPLAGYWIYRLVSGAATVQATPDPRADRRRVIAAGVAGYLALNLAALLAALEFGIQPLLFKAADGTPLYAPYGPEIAVPAMMTGHLLVGIVEALLTGLVVAYLLRSHREVLVGSGSAALEEGKGPAALGHGEGPEQRAPKLGPAWRPWVALLAVALFTPLGLLAAGTAWGEWGPDELTGRGLGFIPRGMERLGSLWNAPIPDYAVPFLGEKVGYVVSALLGIGLIVAVFWIVGRLVDRPVREKNSG